MKKTGSLKLILITSHYHPQLQNICDGYNHCGDGSDESPETCRDNCGGTEGSFQCANGKCIHALWKCDGSNFMSCEDGSDETLWGCAQG